MIDNKKIEMAIDIGATNTLRVMAVDGKIRIFGDRRGYSKYVDLNEDEYEFLAKICNLTHGEIVERYNNFVRDTQNFKIVHQSSVGYTEILVDK